jgi:GNAT superfamily N-acetyltransferase
MSIQIRESGHSDEREIAELICVSHNTWSLAHGLPAPFPGGPTTTALFYKACRALENSFCIVAQDRPSGSLSGVTFYHVRPTHVSLGMMSVHPGHFRRGVAKALLAYIVGAADREGKPLRLISSALNLDSYSLYTKAGCVPRQLYQDIILTPLVTGSFVPVSGTKPVRRATVDDVSRIVELEGEISGILRANDIRFLLSHGDGPWCAWIHEGGGGGIEGFIACCDQGGLNMIGPGFTRTQEQAHSLIHSVMAERPGKGALVLVPVECETLVRHLYEAGGKNNELHVHQVRGVFKPFRGVNLPTFMLESG